MLLNITGVVSTVDILWEPLQVYACGRPECAPCHSGAGYVQWVKTGRPSDDLGLPTAVSGDLAPATNFTCVTCHDPHSNENPAQLRASETILGNGTVDGPQIEVKSLLDTLATFLQKKKMVQFLFIKMQIFQQQLMTV